MSKRRASVVFDHFYIPDNGEEVCKARCKYCPLEMSFNRKATSNLLNHMKRKHASIPLDPVSSITTHWAPMPTKSMLAPKKWHSTDASQVQADRALVNLIAGEQLHVSIVESPFFLSFMQEVQPAYNVPSRHHFVNSLVCQQYNLLHGQLEALVKAAQSICLTVDVWSGEQGCTYMAAKGHLIVDYTLKSVLFSCKRVRGFQTAEDILSYCETILAIYKTPSKIAIVVSDNTAPCNTSLPGFVQHGESPLASAAEPEVKMEGQGAPAPTGESTSSSSTTQYVSQYEPSFAHALQLVVRDGLLAIPKATADVLAKVSAMAYRTRDAMPGSATDRLEDQLKGQATGCAPWNRQLKLVKSILGDQDDQLGPSTHTNPSLTALERAILEDFLHIMRPFEEITDRIQGERVVPASLVIPSIWGIRKHLSSQSEHNHKMVVGLTISTDKWLQQYEAKSSYLRATILDPRLKLRWTEGDHSSRLKDDLLSMTGASAGDTREPASASEALCPPRKKCLFPFFEDEPQHSAPSPHVEEVETYLQEPCIPYHQDPLVFWRGNLQRFPRLSSLALQYLCIPASPVPTLHPDSTGLPDGDFESLTFIKLNNSLLQ
ncbi:zinc finger BED domain-containing protein 4-like [Scleropages formosus]|uniref:Zinc finger BED domain-containing protein 4-like n=1 Tax=Scleropages formosus TaxID=113540 RepID=A0A8C9TNN7_SCLFO|nr:zinc finger BED domain-containing protein 4-like [Scleropages formosus]